MGQSDLDPRTINLNLNVNLPVEILYQYGNVALVERLNNGTITACLRKGSVYRYKNKTNHPISSNSHPSATAK